MKKIFLLIIPAILLFAVSCGDDEDKDVALKGHPIIGEWAAESYSYDIKTGNIILDETIKNAMGTEMPSIVGETATFNEDGTVESTYKGKTERMKYSINGSNKLTLQSDEVGELTANFSISGNSLTLVFDLKPMIEKMYLEEYGGGLPSGIKIEKAEVKMTMTRK